MNLREKIRMSDAELVAFLRENRMLTCASNGRDGWPHVVPLNYVLHPGPQLWCWTYRASQKARNLVRDPRATVQVEAGESYDELRGAMLRCTVAFDDEVERAYRFGLTLMSRNAGIRVDDLDADVRDRVRRQAPKRVVLQFTPRSAVTWDHRKLAAF